MKNYKLPNVLCNSCIEEQETLISWSRQDDCASIYTTDNTTLTKLRKLVEANKGYVIKRIEYNQDGTACAVTVTCPIKCVSLLNERAKKEYTEEQQEQIRNKLKKARMARK